MECVELVSTPRSEADAACALLGGFTHDRNQRTRDDGLDDVGTKRPYPLLE